MRSTDALKVGFFSLLTIVNEGSSLTIVNEMTIFINTIVLKNDRFEKQSFWKTTIFKKTNF